ncbi:MAG: hypothetical protein M0R21_00185 [Lentimicrobiaceae bacterium]|nr:hypothetical protein [Lentimicrobiaceae bacterium]
MDSTSLPGIFVTIPLMDELENTEALFNCLNQQEVTYATTVIIVVNQPERWWNDANKLQICENNQQTIEKINKIIVNKECKFPVRLIDASSPGKAWTEKAYGVGQARKVVMDAASALAGEKDIIVSMDGDTLFGNSYLQSIGDSFRRNPSAVAMAVPYYHHLTENELINRAILRYEIYMRCYLLNLIRINNPYAFTALGSAMACTVRAYRVIMGITPHKSGEDFYFLQKLCKYGTILTANEDVVYPAARFSDRVFFGTGPALIKGSRGDWSSYPVYDYRLFNLVKQTYDAFPLLYTGDIETPMTPFLQQVFGEEDIWKALRKNFKSQEMFVKACRHKVDALRILQFLKARQMESRECDEKHLIAFMSECFSPHNLNFSKNFSFAISPVSELDMIRNFLFVQEKSLRK